MYVSDNASQWYVANTGVVPCFRGGSLFGYWHGSAQAEQESLNGPSFI